MVNARTLAIGAVAVVGAGILASNEAGQYKYTKYQIADDTTLYVNNDFVAIPEEKGIEIAVSGDVVPENGNAGFLEIDMGLDSRYVISHTYEMIQEFQGDTEVSCSYFMKNEHKWVTIPEAAAEGDFSDYALTMGTPSNGPVGANIDPRDCTNGREVLAEEDKLFDIALDHAEEHHGIDKKRALNNINTWTISCQEAREHAIRAYYDPEVADPATLRAAGETRSWNQCRFIPPGTKKTDRSPVTHYPFSRPIRDPIDRAHKFTRVSGSQMDFFNKMGGGENSWSDWACNLGFGKRTSGSGIGFIFGWISFDSGLFNIVRRQHEVIYTDPGCTRKNDSNGNKCQAVKSCYKEYMEHNMPCRDEDKNGSVEHRCIGHSLGGGVCAVGIVLNRWEKAVAFQPVPSVRTSLPAGSSFRYSMGFDIASNCIYTGSIGLEWGYYTGLNIHCEKIIKKTKKKVDRRYRDSRTGIVRTRKATVTVKEVLRGDIIRMEKIYSSWCVRMHWPAIMFKSHAVRHINTRCPYESGTASPSQMAWLKRYAPDTIPTVRGKGPQSGPARRD